MTPQKGFLSHRLWDVERGPFVLLGIIVITVFVVSPLVVTGYLDPLLFDVFFAVIMFMGVLTVHPGSALRYVVLILVILAILTRIASKIVPGTAIMVIRVIIEVAAIGIFAWLVMKQFLFAGRTASDRIGGAIVVYLLLGVLWSRLYEIAGVAVPGAFHMTDGHVTITSYVYFSFVTLATIGYGDMYPVHPLVRSLAVLEAITGQMYIAVLIARLVSGTQQPGDGKG